MKLEKKERIEDLLQEEVISVDLLFGLVLNEKGNALGFKHNTGYTCMWIKGKYYNAHDIIAVAAGLDVVNNTINHIDGIKSNNSIANLEAVSQKENSRHAFNTGLNSRRRYPKELIGKVKTELIKGEKNKSEISRTYGVSVRTVFAIAAGHIHKSVAAC